ncbi:hypothetical protein Btru_025079 [Bulinus truncatus]|nr:hypothetical protein Btru_025079 [Bulinus truncatus]
MSVITKVPEANLWDEICKEFAALRSSESDFDNLSVSTEYHDFDASKHTPVFYGKLFSGMSADADVAAEFDPAVSHPACIGYSFADKPPKRLSPVPPPIPDKFTCSPTEFLNYHIYPSLLPALEAMLRQAKMEKCFERKRTKFNACDFLTEHLFRHNPFHKDESREEVPLLEIPFVKSWLAEHPRPALPKSLLWSDEEAALRIQCYWRGYRVRKNPEVQELRIWQREWREEISGIQKRVTEFWDEKMPEEDSCKTVPPEDNTYLYKEIIIESPSQICTSPS